MRTDKYLRWFLALFIVVVSAMPTGATEYPSNGELNWDGLTWDVRSGGGAPGPNTWNANGVYIDDQNRLHLTIVKNLGVWKCSEVDSRNKYGYGTFTWTVASPVFSYNKNSVVGLFTYLDDSQELDVEISRWGVASGNNLWYSVQPYSLSGNNQGSLENYMGTTIHTIDWQPSSIKFKSTTENGQVLSEFTYTGKIPSNPQHAIMNLWLTKGLAPSDGKNIDLIISDFSYVAYQQGSTAESIDDSSNSSDSVKDSSDSSDSSSSKVIKSVKHSGRKHRR
jgi:hypothetical protein